MASLIPGFDYDVFISYRQKDNKGDRWVSEFVEALKTELDATLKEEISVYFDINKHDGLLETHDVDASLKERLKCLIFIPILSRTYCDPRSFAWRHEFRAFVEQALQDKFGMKVRLPNGNVANRVLPVRIHELNTADIHQFESVLGAVIRGIEFIYKSQGVNRPLRINEDHPQDNINKIYYRDQINKVANAIEEIIGSLIRIELSGLIDSNIYEETKAQDTGTFDSYEISEVPDIKVPFKITDSLRKRRKKNIKSTPKYWFEISYKYIIPGLVTVLLLAYILGWKGLPEIFGGGNSKRELAKTYNENAVRYFDNGEYGPAKTEAERALASDPKYSYAWSTLAAISVKQGDLDKAVRQTLEALNCDPANKTAAYNLAYAFEEKKLNDRALEWYSNSIKADSTFVEAYSALGRLYNVMNQPDNAFLILSLAKNKYPESEYIYLINKNLGNAHLLMNHLDEAIKYLELSREVRPEEPETNLYLAKAYEADGQTAISIEQWQRYIESETDTVKIKEAIQHRKDLAFLQLKEIIK
jgi:Tfp pilus assembly protein PilF